MYVYNTTVHTLLFCHTIDFAKLNAVVTFFKDAATKDKQSLKPIELGLISTAGGAILVDHATDIWGKRSHEQEAEGI